MSVRAASTSGSSGTAREARHGQPAAGPVGAGQGEGEVGGCGPQLGGLVRDGPRGRPAADVGVFEGRAQGAVDDLAAGLADRHALAEALDAVRGGDDLAGLGMVRVGDDAHGSPRLTSDSMRGVYVHVPYCTARCGYCDFNTYVVPEAERAGYPALAVLEIERAAHAWPGPVDTVFFGGGTPTLLAPNQLAAILAVIEERFGLAAGAEVTTEANPESVGRAALSSLREAGFTRVSLGMQSAAPHVLAALDRVHTPGRAVEAAREARAAGFEHVSLDLIYGTPGESDDDWRASIEAALTAGPD